MISSVSSAIAVSHGVPGVLGRPAAADEPAQPADPSGLSEEERQEVERLKERDREVRAHEQAHSRTGGQYAGSPSYEFERGPDGRLYAVSGEVQIDTAPVAGNPAATITKMEIVIRAALAPAEPSAQDRRVAAEARAAKAEAQSELRAEKQAEARGDDSGVPNGQDSEFGRAANAYEQADSLIFAVSDYAFRAAA